MMYFVFVVRSFTFPEMSFAFLVKCVVFLMVSFVFLVMSVVFLMVSFVFLVMSLLPRLKPERGSQPPSDVSAPSARISGSDFLFFPPSRSRNLEENKDEFFVVVKIPCQN